MSDERPVPWWYSGDESGSDESGSAEASGAGTSSAETSGAETSSAETGRGPDRLGLLSGAARMVDWAAAAVSEPHGDHRDPAAPPEGLVCRTVVLVQDRTGLMAPSPDAPAAAQPAPPAVPVRWLEIRDADAHGADLRHAEDESA